MKHRKEKHEAHMSSNDTRLAILETTIININSNMIDIKQDLKRLSDRMDKKFEASDTKLDALDKKFDSKFDLLNNRLWTHFFWLMGMIVGLAGLIAHAHHWI